MKACDLMSPDVECVRPQTRLQEAAEMMAEHDVGLLPVVDDEQRLVGVVSDRDIVCRTIAQGLNPLELSVSDAMSQGDIWSVTPETEAESVHAVMQEHQVRRVPVVDRQGKCCGIIAQADVARQGTDPAVADVVQAVSRPR
jgi:CBS domain-containing protein